MKWHFLIVLLVVCSIGATGVGTAFSKENVNSDSSVLSSNGYTIDQISDGASRLDAYIQKWHTLPKSLVISSKDVSMPDF